LSRDGCEVCFFASKFTSSFVGGMFQDGLVLMGPNRLDNQRAWELLLRDFNPQHIVFADYPLLTLSSGTAPLHDNSWEHALNDCNADLFTLDHLGYAQHPRLLFFGPPHGTLGIERIPALPPRMQILLPCPLHDPATTSLRGHLFQYWRDPGKRNVRDPAEIRAPYVRSADELLVLHLTSHWACQAAELLMNPYYAFLPRLLSYYLGSLSRPVTVLAINNGCLLPEQTSGHVRILNAGPITPQRYEDLVS